MIQMIRPVPGVREPYPGRGVKGIREGWWRPLPLRERDGVRGRQCYDLMP
jgi:hypothetical protein